MKPIGDKAVIPKERTPHRTPLSPPSQHARRARPAVDSPISHRGPEATPAARNAAKEPQAHNERRVEVRPRDQFAGGLRARLARDLDITAGHTSYRRPRSLIGTSKKPRWPFTGCGSMRSINVRIQAIAPPSGSRHPRHQAAAARGCCCSIHARTSAREERSSAGHLEDAVVVLAQRASRRRARGARAVAQRGRTMRPS